MSGRGLAGAPPARGPRLYLWPARRRAARSAIAVAVCAPLLGCWRIGEPTPSAAHVAWAAYPETVMVAETFSFEFAGPVAPSTCGRLDTATLSVGDSIIELAARRSTFDALCANQRVSFYEARPLVLERAGRYLVRTAEGRELGTLVALDSGAFTPLRAIGEGTLETAGGCLLFGPGWMGNQRPFALQNAGLEIEELANTDRIVYVEGRLLGFSLCSWFGSRPTIRVDTARATRRRGADYYR